MRLPKKIKDLSPKKITVPYFFYVYDREYDNYNNEVTYIKNLCGRRTFYVKAIQK